MTNLHAKERRHHNLKTHRVWTSTTVEHGGLEWTTLTGRTYTTFPKNWREGVHPPRGTGPPDEAVVEHDPSDARARRVAVDDDVPPF
ncbi:MAG: hypothetical protein ACKOVB_21015 [Terrabacter sp.]